jgi:hypothetical protein
LNSLPVEAPRPAETPQARLPEEITMYPNANPAPSPAVPNPIDSAIASLKGENNVLAEKIGYLFDRLHTVLRPDVPRAETNPKIGAVSESHSPLCDAIVHNAGCVSEASRRINDLLERLEL